MSSMVHFWASTDSSFVPNVGPRVWSHAIRRKLCIVQMTAAHISPNVFSPHKLPQQHTWTVSYDTFNIIHIYCTLHLHEQLYLLFTWHIHTFISLDLHGRQAALGPLCPIHEHPFVLSAIEGQYTAAVKGVSRKMNRSKNWHQAMDFPSFGSIFFHVYSGVNL